MTVALDAVRKSVTVRATPQRAFEVFAAMGGWWPFDTHHTGDLDAIDVVVEPRAGGRWFERADDGTEADWGRVLAFEPPSRLLLAWHLDAEFTYDPDPDRASEVEVTFADIGDGRTEVVLEHRRLDVFGGAAAGVRAQLDGEGGWSGLLALYADHV